MRVAIKKGKSLALELKENIACKNEILKEYREIRHEYNNILQGVICFVEEEDWEGLKEYKGKLLEKTRVLNTNNLTQLVKLKDNSILNVVYKLLIDAKQCGSIIYLTIYTEIEDISPCGIKLYESLEECLTYALKVATKDATTVSLKISGNNEGILFAFKNTFDMKDYNNILKLIKIKRKMKSKKIFCNTFIEMDQLKQEILISNPY
jgi:L-ribulose-5-phosphate 3-epimerase UlaE